MPVFNACVSCVGLMLGLEGRINIMRRAESSFGRARRLLALVVRQFEIYMVTLRNATESTVGAG
jgi:type VI protein secretion system component VasF